MNIHAWIDDFVQQVMRNRDGERFQLVRMATAAPPLVAQDPDAALALLARARDVAQALNEPWWVLFCDHWSLQALLFHKRDFTTALPMAEQAVAEAQKPPYRELPQVVCLHEDLIFTHLGIDPFGYGEEIQQAMDYMQAQVAPNCPCYNCLLEIRTTHALTIGDQAGAEQAGIAAIKAAWPVSDYHHVVIAYSHLCHTAYATEQWDKLALWSAAADNFADRDSDETYLLELKMWQAVSACHDGSPQAVAYYQTARRRQRRLFSLPTSGFYDAWCAFHEQRGDTRRARQVRERELSALIGSGQTFLEARCRVHRCRLLAEQGLLTDEDLRQADAVIARLRDPGPLQQQLQEILAPKPESQQV